MHLIFNPELWGNVILFLNFVIVVFTPHHNIYTIMLRRLTSSSNIYLHIVGLRKKVCTLGPFFCQSCIAEIYLRLSIDTTSGVPMDHVLSADLIKFAELMTLWYSYKTCAIVVIIFWCAFPQTPKRSESFCMRSIFIVIPGFLCK